MLDFRFETFLTLCKIRNYTKTAETLRISQPAVSQHMKYLENRYGGKLFYYEGKTLQLTERGLRLQEFASTVRADSIHMRNLLLHADPKMKAVAFGATLSIGEYVMPPILSALMLEEPSLELHMQVGNTQALLAKLHDGEINFALIEGFFNKAEYGWELFSDEEFIAVCSRNFELASQELPLNALLDQRLILREKGSGTREILEQLLHERNLSIDSFSQLCEVGNINGIKELVENNLGITFLYRAAVQKELETGILVQINILGFNVQRAFHFVYLKDSVHEEEYLSWFKRFLRQDNKSNTV